MRKLVIESGEIKVASDVEGIELVHVDKINENLNRFLSDFEQYLDIKHRRTITILVTYHDLGGTQEFSYVVSEGPNENGYTINLERGSRYSVAVTDDRNSDEWKVDDYRLDPAPAHWDLGYRTGYGPIQHGHPAPHRFDFVKDDTQFSLNIILV